MLLDRTDGELHRKVVNAGARADAGSHRDAGAKAYVTVYAWFMESTGLKLAERRGAWMNPPPVKHEHEIADAVEAWEREEMELRKLDPVSQELPECFKVIALKSLLVGQIRQHIELMSGRLTGYGDLRREIMGYAMQMRLETNRTGRGCKLITLIRHKEEKVRVLKRLR